MAAIDKTDAERELSTAGGGSVTLLVSARAA